MSPCNVLNLESREVSKVLVHENLSPSVCSEQGDTRILRLLLRFHTVDFVSDLVSGSS
jgi:hypothetical protein